jgi:hypothetical protein
MLYIELTDNYKFENVNGHDALVNLNTTTVIYLSGKNSIIYKYLLGIRSHEIMIYSFPPPNTSQTFLEYLPEKDGLLPCKWKTVVTGKDKNQFQSKTVNNLRFYQSVPDMFSVNRLKELEHWNEEQRWNRRHSGDSPKST